MNRTGNFPPADGKGSVIIPCRPLLCGIAILLFSLPLAAQTTLKDVAFETKLLQAQGPDASLHVDFMLPQPDAVTSLEVKVGGKAAGQDKAKFTPLDKAGSYKCTVLILVDRAMGNGMDTAAKGKLEQSVRGALDRLTGPAESVPYQMAMASFTGNMEVLAKMGSQKKTLDAAASILQFDQASSELQRGLKSAIDWLSAIPADRRFIIVLTDAASADTVANAKDLVDATRPGRIHLCTIGFPRPGAAAGQIQKLDPVVEQTGGYALRAEGNDFNLPADAEGQMLKFMLSGGTAEISLAGLHDTQNVELKALTESNKAYLFSAKADLPPAPPPLPPPPPPPKPELITKPKDIPPPKPVEPPPPPPTRWQVLVAQIKEHKGLAIGAGAGGGLLLLLLLILLLRGKKKPEPTVGDAMWQEIVAPQFSADDETQVLPPPLPPEDPVLAWLISLDAEQTRHAIRRTAVRLGRKPDNDIVLKNDSVSSHHAEIVKRGQNFVIADLEASNGILVNGKRVEKTTLANDDMIELGEVRFRFVVNNPES